MVLHVPCFGVRFCTVSPSVCLDDVYLGLGSGVATFWKRAVYSANLVFSLLYLFVALIVSYFGFKDRTLVLIASVCGHCLPFTFRKTDSFAFILLLLCQMITVLIRHC